MLKTMVLLKFSIFNDLFEWKSSRKIFQGQRRAHLNPSAVLSPIGGSYAKVKFDDLSDSSTNLQHAFP